MKRTIVVAVALAFVLLSAGAAFAGIAGSKHDMRTWLTDEAVGEGYDEVCVYCHTPHSASSAAQLWNRTGVAIGSYMVYTSSTMNATPGQPGAGSQLCLSCHDGTIAVNNLVNPPNNAPSGAPTDYFIANTNAAYMGTDLTNDHPIGLDYGQSASGDAGLIPIGTVTTAGTVRLISGTQVECASCHDAHNATAVPFLRTSNVESLLCTACHLK